MKTHEESELERQCKIRNLPFDEVKYLVDSIVKEREEALVEKIMSVPELQIRALGSDGRTSVIRGILNRSGVLHLLTSKDNQDENNN